MLLSIKTLIGYCLASLLLFGPYTASAREQAAHIHGAATLMLALEKGVLDIQFESPAINLLGFEHQAKSAEERQRVQQTELILRAAKKLFFFTGSRCTPVTITVNTHNVLADELDNVDDRHHEHDSHHQAEHKHNHGDSGHEHDQSEKHSEISASYRFSCDSTVSISSISTALFTHFPAIEKINALWVTPTTQGGSVLSASDNTVSLK